MRRFQKLYQRKWIVGLLILFLLGGSIGSARAALTIYSENTYTAQIDLSDIGVSLLENGVSVAKDGENGELLKNLLGENEKFVPGKQYDEQLEVCNSGTIDEYIRVNVYKRWIKDGKPYTAVSPDLIQLDFNTQDWIFDEDISTAERSVFYLKHVLKSGETSPALSTKLSVSKEVNSKVKESREGNMLTYTYVYNGIEFSVEAIVEAIQAHNAEQAVQSAWGVDFPQGVRINSDNEKIVSTKNASALYKNNAKAIKTNYSESDIDKVVMALQPGDTASFVIDLVNEAEENTNWYMINTVGKTLEDANAVGGAYSYRLTYHDGQHENRVLYSSEMMGGDYVNGLYSITDELGNYVWLGELDQGEMGYVTLEVTLDGETQGNNYWKTFARINMDFAIDSTNVSLNQETPSGDHKNESSNQNNKNFSLNKNPSSNGFIRSNVKTGDFTPVLVLGILSAFSGIVCLVLLFILIVRRKRN